MLVSLARLVNTSSCREAENGQGGQWAFCAFITPHSKHTSQTGKQAYGQPCIILKLMKEMTDCETCPKCRSTSLPLTRIP